MVQVAAKKEVQKFCADTSAHGLPRIAAAEDRKTRWAWGILLFICLCSLTYQIIMVIEKYQRHEKIVNVEVQSTLDYWNTHGRRKFVPIIEILYTHMLHLSRGF